MGDVEFNRTSPITPQIYNKKNQNPNKKMKKHTKKKRRINYARISKTLAKMKQDKERFIALLKYDYELKQSLASNNLFPCQHSIK